MIGNLFVTTFDGYEYALAAFGEFLLVGVKDTWRSGILSIGTKVQIRSSLREFSSNDIRVTFVHIIISSFSYLFLHLIISSFMSLSLPSVISSFISLSLPSSHYLFLQLFHFISLSLPSSHYLFLQLFLFISLSFFPSLIFSYYL